MSKTTANSVRIGPRISKPLYMLAKYVYSLQGINLEDRVQELIRKDLETLTKQRWYLDTHAGMNQADLQLFASAIIGIEAAKGDGRSELDESDTELS